MARSWNRALRTVLRGDLSSLPAMADTSTIALLATRTWIAPTSANDAARIQRIRRAGQHGV